jgi:hypothetical protein
MIFLILCQGFRIPPRPCEHAVHQLDELQRASEISAFVLFEPFAGSLPAHVLPEHDADAEGRERSCGRCLLWLAASRRGVSHEKPRRSAALRTAQFVREIVQHQKKLREIGKALVCLLQRTFDKPLRVPVCVACDPYGAESHLIGNERARCLLFDGYHPPFLRLFSVYKCSIASQSYISVIPVIFPLIIFMCVTFCYLFKTQRMKSRRNLHCGGPFHPYSILPCRYHSAQTDGVMSRPCGGSAARGRQSPSIMR